MAIVHLLITWWQTENGGHMISAIAGVTPLKPGYAGLRYRVYNLRW